jgi:hypothetical protein
MPGLFAKKKRRPADAERLRSCRSLGQGGRRSNHLRSRIQELLAICEAGGLDVAGAGAEGCGRKNRNPVTTM